MSSGFKILGFGSVRLPTSSLVGVLSAGASWSSQAAPGDAKRSAGEVRTGAGMHDSMVAGTDRRALSAP